MYQIAIVGKPSPLRFQLSKTLQTNPTYHLLTYSSPGQMLEAIDKYGLSAIVFSLEAFGRPQMKQLEFIDSNFRSVPLLLVAPRIPDDLRFELSKCSFDNIRILDSRFEIADVSAVVGKLGNGEPVFHRAHCRYRTHQTGEIAGNLGSHSRVRLINISQGGVQLELRDLEAIYDDTVLLHVRSSHRAHPTTVRAEVRWQDPKTRRVGLRFMEGAEQRPMMLL